MKGSKNVALTYNFSECSLVQIKYLCYLTVLRGNGYNLTHETNNNMFPLNK